MLAGPVTLSDIRRTLHRWSDRCWRLVLASLPGRWPLFAIRCLKACSLAPKLRSNPDSYEPCGRRMTYDRHGLRRFGRPVGQTAYALRHCVRWAVVSSVLEAWSHCGETVPRSGAHGGVITFWALLAQSVPDDEGMTGAPICLSASVDVTGELSKTQAKPVCERFCSRLYLIVARFRRGFVRGLCAARTPYGSAHHWSRFCRR